MDEHEQRAREVMRRILDGTPPIGTEQIASALRAAVAAERKRCGIIVEDALETAMGHASSGDACGWLETVHDEICSGRPVDDLRENPPAMPAPAQAEQRVSEDDNGEPDQCGCVGDPRDPRTPVCTLTPGHSGPHAVDPVAASRSRIAARLRARADREDAEARHASERGWVADAIKHRGTAAALRAEAGALEGQP